MVLEPPNRIENYFGTLDTPVGVTASRNAIATVFNKLTEKEKYSKMVEDKTHVKRAVKYQENHIIEFPHDEPTNAARTILAIMIQKQSPGGVL